MANTLRIKKRAASGADGAPSSLASSELALNESDLKLYYGFGDNGSGVATSIITIGGSGAFISKTDAKGANLVLAGPTTGSDANPTFRSLVAADIPSIAHTKISDFDTGVRVNRLDQMSAPTANIDINSNELTNVSDPTSAQSVATKAYVDAVKTGLDVKGSVKVATTANITLSGTQTIDGIAVSADERVLVKNQSTGSQNGIYDCKAGAWARSSDFDANTEVTSGAFVFVEQGTVNADAGFVLTTDGTITVGTTALSFTQFSGAGQITAGDGLQKSGNALSADLKANGGLVIESAEIALKLDASSITGTLAVGDGGTGATSASAARSALGLVIGTNVQGFDQQLADVAGLAVTDGGFIVGNGSNFVLETGATARTSIGAQTLAADLTNLSSCQSGASAALAALTSTEVAILDGATLSTAELNYVDGVTSSIQTQLDAKQALDAQLTDVAGLAVTDGGFIVGDGSNFVLETGATARTSIGAQTLAADLTTLSSCQSGGASALAALTSTEIGILDGATVTTTELNIIDGGTAATSTTLAAADRMVMNDAGTMKQVALSDLITFIANGTASSYVVDGGTY